MFKIFFTDVVELEMYNNLFKKNSEKNKKL